MARGPSGYILFGKEYRKTLAEENKGSKNLKPKEIIKKIAEKWKSLAPEEREKYNKTI